MKKSNLWKGIAALSMSALTLFTAVSCGGTNKKNADQTDFLIVGGMSTLSSGNDGNPVLIKLAEEAGVEIEWDLMSDSLGEKVGVLIGGNQLPDAFIACQFSQGDIVEYGEDEIFIDLTEYITPEIMPRLSAILAEHPEIKSAITQADGGIYGLPSGELMGTAAIGASNEENLSIYAIPEFSMINKTWLDALGLPVPTNLTELHDALKAFKDNNMGGPNTIPMSTGYDQWCWGQEIFYSGFGFTNFTSDVCNDLVVRDGKVEFVSATEAYRDAITYFHDWFAEGLMDLEMFSQGSSQLIAKVSQGKVGVTTWWYIEEIAGDHADDFVFLPPMYGPTDAFGGKYAKTRTVNLRTAPAVTSGNLNITSACGNPELLCKYFDQWYDPETVMQLQYGPIGIYFSEEKNADGIWEVIDEATAKAKYGKSSGELKGQYEVYGPRLILAEYYNNVFELEQRAIVRLEDLNNFWMPYVQSKEAYPNDVNFTTEELNTIKRYKPDFTSQVAEYEGLWLKNGGPSDKEWADYLKMLEDNCGMKKLLATYQDAYTRYLGK